MLQRKLGEAMIPFNRAYYTEEEQINVACSILSTETSGDKAYTKLCHEYLEKNFSINKALLTTSCSMALDMASILIDLEPGDEVIMPSYNFVSAANSVVLRKSRPIFAEISSDTLTIDVDKIESLITSKTKAIIPVHYAGVSCDMDKLMKLAQSYNLKVIEDAAQGVNAKYKGKFLGTIGDLGAYSFHETKNYSCGEGGCIMINSNEELVRKAEVIREKGTNRSQFLRGEVDKYTWVEAGSSFLMSDVLAALLYGQLQKKEEIQTRRKEIFESYINQFQTLSNSERLGLPQIPKYNESNYHIFYLILPTPELRNSLMDYLKSQGIGATFHYIPLHLSPMGSKLGYKEGDFSLTENLSARILRLPIYPDLKNNQIDYIVDKVNKWITRI